MYFIRKIKKTKKQTSKSSFIASLPKKLQRKIASYNKEISKRLENFARFRYFYEDVEKPKCFLLSLWSNELPPNSIHDKESTTTIQRSGKSSRYVLIPKKVCNKFGWGAGTELVIGLDYNIDEYVQGAIYKNDHCFVKDDTSGQETQVCVIKFQIYRDMKNLYRARLARKKAELAKQESDAYWSTRNRPSYDIIMDRIRYEKKHIHRLVWNRLLQMNLVAISYTDFVKLRSEKEREKKRKRKQFLKKRYGSRSTWRYRRNLVRSGRRGYDYDAYRENKLDNPDSYIENKADDPEYYNEPNTDLYHKDEPESQDE
ncbi:MAG: hypothetical protein ACREA3_07830 [Nitrosotalea sp.]